MSPRSNTKTNLIGESTAVRLLPQVTTALDIWIAQQPVPKPSRSDVIRTALKVWLADKGLLTYREDPDGSE